MWVVCKPTGERTQKTQKGTKVDMKLIDHMNKLIWSQAELSRRAGVSLPTVQNAIRGKVITRASALKILEAVKEATGEKLTIADLEGMKVESVTIAKRNTRRKTKKGE